MSTKRKRKKNAERNGKKPSQSVTEKMKERITRPDSWIYRHPTAATIINTTVLAILAAAALGAITGCSIFLWLEKNDDSLGYYTTLLLVGTAGTDHVRVGHSNMGNTTGQQNGQGRRHNEPPTNAVMDSRSQMSKNSGQRKTQTPKPKLALRC